MTAKIESNYILPGRAESYWMATTPESNYFSLSGDIHIDVAILGDGLWKSRLLPFKGSRSFIRCSGRADRIFEGVTGHTTAKVTSQHHMIYDYLL